MFLNRSWPHLFAPWLAELGEEYTIAVIQVGLGPSTYLLSFSAPPHPIPTSLGMFRLDPSTTINVGTVAHGALVTWIPANSSLAGTELHRQAVWDTPVIGDLPRLSGLVVDEVRF